MRFSKLVRSFGFGFLGLSHALGSEQSLRIHGVIAVGVIVAGFVFALAAWEWIVVILCIGLVIAAECVNTAVERLANRVSLEPDPLIKQAKDCSAAAVLVLSLATGVVGGLIFVPRIWAWTGW